MVLLAPPAAAGALHDELRVDVLPHRGGVQRGLPLVVVGCGDVGRGHGPPGGGVGARDRSVPPAQARHVDGVGAVRQVPQQGREGVLGLAADHVVDEGVVAVQGVAHRPVAVAAAEDHRQLRPPALEFAGEREGGDVLHEGAGEPDDVRPGRQHLLGAGGDERGGVRPHGDGGADEDVPLGGVGAQPGQAPVRVVVQDAGEDPVAEAVEDGVAADGDVVVRPQPAAGALQQELRPAQRAVELGHLGAGFGAPDQPVQQAELERGQVERMPGHRDQVDAHAQRVGRFSRIAGRRPVPRSSSRTTTFLISMPVPPRRSANTLVPQPSTIWTDV